MSSRSSQYFGTGPGQPSFLLSQSRLFGLTMRIMRYRPSCSSPGQGRCAGYTFKLSPRHTYIRVECVHYPKLIKAVLHFSSFKECSESDLLYKINVHHVFMGGRLLHILCFRLAANLSFVFEGFPNVFFRYRNSFFLGICPASACLWAHCSSASTPSLLRLFWVNMNKIEAHVYDASSRLLLAPSTPFSGPFRL